MSTPVPPEIQKAPPPQRVTVVDLDISIGQMFALLLKFAFAAFFAGIIIGVFMLTLGVIATILGMPFKL